MEYIRFHPTPIRGPCANKPMGWYCTVCESEMGISNKTTHLNGKRHAQKMRKRDLLNPRGTTASPAMTTGLVEVEEEEEEEEEEDGNEESEQDDDDQEELEELEDKVERWVANIEQLIDPGATNSFPDDWHEIPNQISPPMIWACATCDESMNIFSRSDHLNGKAHAKMLRRQPQSPSPKAAPEPIVQPSWTWQCTICDETMNIFYKDEHLTGRRHAKVLQVKGISQYPTSSRDFQEFAASVYQTLDRHDIVANAADNSSNGVVEIPPSHLAGINRAKQALAKDQSPEVEAAESAEPTSEVGGLAQDPDGDAEISSSENTQISPTTPSITSAGMFNCRICDAEFILKYRWMHLRKAWKCQVCNRWLHIDWRDRHLARHTKRSETATTTAEPTTTATTADKAGERSPRPNGTNQYHEPQFLVNQVWDSEQETSPEREAGKDANSHAQEFPPRNSQPEDQPQETHEYTPGIGISSDHESTYDSQNHSLQQNEEIGDERPSTKQGETPPETSDPITPETFRCTVCGDREYSIEKQRYHAGRAWECTVCNKTIHRSRGPAHLAGGKHARHELQERKEPNNAPTSRRVGTKRRMRELQKRTESHNAVQAEDIAAAPTHKAPETPPDIPNKTDPEKFYCETCGTDVKTMYKKLHQSRAWECTICDITIHTASKHSHLAGRKHTKKVTKVAADSN